MVNEVMARRFWKDQDPVGRRFKLGGPDSAKPWITVVGVVGNVRQRGLDTETKQEMYVPLPQSAAGSLTLVLRSAADLDTIVRSVRSRVREVDPAQPLYEFRTMDNYVSESLARRRFSLALLGVFAGLAMIFSIGGVYSVMSYAVSQRTREIGVRLALGANAGDIMRLILRKGAVITLTGVLFGALGALASMHAIASMLYGVNARDLVVLSVSATVLSLMAMIACYVPAKRAVSLDPCTALRQ
jgi:ABC-type antimicrobial peptide transport system permease subunit